VGTENRGLGIWALEPLSEGGKKSYLGKKGGKSFRHKYGPTIPGAVTTANISRGVNQVIIAPRSVSHHGSDWGRGVGLLKVTRKRGNRDLWLRRSAGHGWGGYLQSIRSSKWKVAVGVYRTTSAKGRTVKEVVKVPGYRKKNDQPKGDSTNSKNFQRKSSTGSGLVTLGKPISARELAYSNQTVGGLVQADRHQTRFFGD